MKRRRIGGTCTAFCFACQRSCSRSRWDSVLASLSAVLMSSRMAFICLRCPPINRQLKRRIIFLFRNDDSNSLRFLTGLPQNASIPQVLDSRSRHEPGSDRKISPRIQTPPREPLPAYGSDVPPFIFLLAPKGLHRGVIPAVALS